MYVALYDIHWPPLHIGQIYKHTPKIMDTLDCPNDNNNNDDGSQLQS